MPHIPFPIPIKNSGVFVATAPFLQNIAVKFADKGDNVIIEGIEDQSIDVYAIALTCETSVNLQLMDGGTTLGFFYNQTNFFFGPVAIAPLFELAVGSLFVINLPDSVACQGTVWYTQQHDVS